MFQNPVIQNQLARELDRAPSPIRRDQHALPATESVLDAVIRRLRELVNSRPLQPAAGAS